MVHYEHLQGTFLNDLPQRGSVQETPGRLLLFKLNILACIIDKIASELVQGELYRESLVDQAV